MINIAIVNYLNTKPFLNGLKNASLNSDLKIIETVPSACSDLLKNGKADIALIPSVELLEIPGAQIIPGYCIACDGLVQTVCLVSNDPLDEIYRIYLDDHSRTSNQLVQILLEEQNGREIQYLLKSVENLELKQGEAKLMIGDKAFFAKDNFKYCYDLGLKWKEKTQMPFVFAVWASTIQLDQAFLNAFNFALNDGIQKIPQLIQDLGPLNNELNLFQYYTQNIEYVLDSTKMKALAFYLDIVKAKLSIKMSAP